MPLTIEQKRRYLLAKKNPELAMFEMFNELEKTAQTMAKTVLEQKEKELKKEMEDKYKEFAKTIPSLADQISKDLLKEVNRNPYKFLGPQGPKGPQGPEGKKGEKGDTLGDREILRLIEDNMPPPIPGYTPKAGVDYPSKSQFMEMIKKALPTPSTLMPYLKKAAIFALDKLDYKKVARGLEKLKGKDRLDYNALKNTPDIPTDGKIERKVKAVLRGGGDRIRPYSITGDGSTKSWTIPANKRIIAVFASDFPYIYKPTTDYGTTGSFNTTITLTSEVNAPSNGATLEVIYVE